MKKLIAIISTLAITLSLCFTVSGCKTKTVDVKQALTMCVIAGSSYFNDSAIATLNATNDGATNSTSLADEPTAKARPSAVLNDIPDFNKYIKMFEGYLSTGNTGIKDSALSEDEKGKTFGEYATDSNTVKREITLAMLNSDNVVYTMYYNEYDISSSVETDDDGDETNETAQIKGACVLPDGSFYALKGKRQSEVEIGESEVKFEFIIQKDENTFIKMQSESEVETDETENEVTFSLYENGALVSKTEIEFETENDKVEMKLKFSAKGQGASKVFYKIKNEVVDGKNVLKVTYKTKSEQGNFKITASDNDYKYSYENGYSETINS